jgi:hypothetical protein
MIEEESIEPYVEKPYAGDVKLAWDLMDRGLVSPELCGLVIKEWLSRFDLPKQTE